MPEWEDRGRFGEAARLLGLNLTEKQLERFAEFEERLYAINRTRNLTRVPRDECWWRHFIDSLLMQNLFPQGAMVLDIGAGPGFPAWPLACARPDLRVTALDSNRKMASFLLDNPLANLKVVIGRAEEDAPRDQFDYVTGRAVAPLTVQLELSAAPLKLNGEFIPMRTEKEFAEIERLDPSVLGLKLMRIKRRPLIGSSPQMVRLFPVYRKLAPTSRLYPRSWAEIRRSPFS